MRVYVAMHAYEDDDGHEYVKLIGIYSTEEKGNRAIEELRLQPGFCDKPNGFSLDAHELDSTQWQDGYVTIPQAD
jgi:hypothetical protein